MAQSGLLLSGSVLVALLIDARVGEPPARWHPVVWMGSYLSRVGRWIAPSAGSPPRGAGRPFAWGALAWCAGAAAVWLVAAGAQQAARALPIVAAALAMGLLLKPLLAWRMLRDEVTAVERSLERSLEEGRARLARLVSREVTLLDAEAVREAAIETLAENLNDSVVAPLFWFALAGLPGAALYRFANTADAMWGYMGEREGRDWTFAGRWAARADDVLSWVPARLTALLLCLPRALHALRQLPAQARLTPSPNSGWPMAAMALVLGVRLAKPGVYTLNARGRGPSVADTAWALRKAAGVVRTIAWLAFIVAVAALTAQWMAGAGRAQ